MSGYRLHPEAYNDLDDIRGYIADHNPDAADRVIIEIFDASQSGFLSRYRPLPPGPYLAASALHPCTRLPDSLCAGQKAVVGCRRDRWTAKPAHHGRDLERQRVILTNGPI